MSDESTFIEDVDKASVEVVESLTGETIGSGRYRLGEVVGKGGFGRVYRAEEVGSDQVWAVKELAVQGSQVVLDTLDKEQKMLSWLDHPTIVTRKEVLSERGRLFLIMEFIEGANLKDRMRDSELSMPEKGVVELALQVLDALSYLHAQKPYPIIFSDLKPANLMLTDQGKVKLVDFGIARVKSPGSEQTLAMGTRGYAAPEQYGKGEIDGRADIYALGVIMHQLLSKIEPRQHRGKLPPVEETATATDSELAAVISRATELKAESRFSSTQYLKLELEKLLRKWKWERSEARMVLVNWAGLAPRDERLVTAIKDSVHEVRSNKAGRAKPWVLTWMSDKRAWGKLGLSIGLVSVAFLLWDGLDLMDWAIFLIVGICLFAWKMKTF